MLTLQFIPNTELAHLTSENKIKKLLTLVKTNRILLVEGRLDTDEETKLIEKTMEQITREFKGIEICTVYPQNKNMQFLDKLKSGLSRALGHKGGLTIIGPATIVKEIKRDPTKIELLTKTKRKRR